MIGRLWDLLCEVMYDSYNNKYAKMRREVLYGTKKDEDSKRES